MAGKPLVFEFSSYNFNPLKKEVVFNYKTEFSGQEPLYFTETIVLPKTPELEGVPKGLTERILKSLHIILGISYYKLYCATEIRIPYELSKGEAEFWNTVYRKGLGEFFYRNKLDPKNSPRFPFQKYKKTDSFSFNNNSKKYLVGIGGGKDSIVAAELLKESAFSTTAFSVQTNKESQIINEIIQKLGMGELKIKRYLDHQVFKTHQYHGHIPISAIYAFLSVFASTLYGYRGFIVSNEYSSNFGNLKYKGNEINHQWSKSLEFEKLFQDYLKNFISPDLEYFSLLRPFYEIRIVKMFSKYKQYFPYFSSCNGNFKIKNLNSALWCGSCAKCVFVFNLLAAFLKKDELTKIFGKNLYEDKELLPMFKDVLGFGKAKPFDCVGTFEESKTALYLAKKNFKGSFIIKELGGKAKFHPEVLKTQKESSIPEAFRFIGMESALILGYGKEGKVSKQYLKKYYPKLKVGIADEKQGKNYLKLQEKFDIAVKTPGIRKELIRIPHTTATNIFFSKLKGKNLIIGVTGSKGKSTTVSLIFEILKTAGRKVELLGNIGKPMLLTLLKPIPKDKIFVLELSSYQLDDIKFSPDISVVTNLFEEHMDYHGGAENYYSAKNNIIKFHDKGGYFIYDPENKLMRKWLDGYNGKSISFAKSTILSKNELPLKGEHNEKNIKAAIAVSKLLNIKDEAIKKALKQFKGLPYRLEFVGKFKGIEFYDDGSSTNPESAILAIKALKNIDTIFLGGEDRGYDFSQLEKTIKKYKIRNLVLFPDSGRKIIKNKKHFNLKYTSSMKEAVKFAYSNTKKGSICLLSGASPSYSLWKGFFQKGDQFKKFVKQLGKINQ